MRIKDWGYTVVVLGVCFLLMCGCDSRSDEGLSLSNGPDAVYLDINVALRDASGIRTFCFRTCGGRNVW